MILQIMREEEEIQLTEVSTDMQRHRQISWCSKLQPHTKLHTVYIGNLLFLLNFTIIKYL